ncbi:hypothetical protein DL96DRAFT_1614466 [Flagelloscypha sp. PMI_526]|nr:hypothetical protein DL96DRAFT_1614466 [Flagelloscypha sp. PMI_526]
MPQPVFACALVLVTAILVSSSPLAKLEKREVITETTIQAAGTFIDLGYYGAPGVSIETKLSEGGAWNPIGPYDRETRLDSAIEPVGVRVAGQEDAAVVYSFPGPNGMYDAISLSVTYTKGYYTTPLTILEGEIITHFSSPPAKRNLSKRTDPYDSSRIPLPYTRQTLRFGAERGCPQQYIFTAVMTDANNATSTQIVTPYNGSWKLTIPEEKPYKVSITHNVDPEFLAEIVYVKNTVIYAQGDSDLITGIEYTEDAQILVCPYGDDD